MEELSQKKGGGGEVREATERIKKYSVEQRDEVKKGFSSAYEALGEALNKAEKELSQQYLSSATIYCSISAAFAWPMSL
jgi:F0F1-type ATP synthase membrane subunit b/b'